MRRFELAGIVVGVALGLSACGGGAAPAASSPPVSAPASAAAKPTSAAPASASAKPAASVPASASAKPAASAAASASAKPAASAAAKPAASGAGDIIRDGTLAPDAFEWTDYVADKEGFYKGQNLNIQNTQLGTPATAAQALVGGSLDIASASADAYITAMEQGADIELVGQKIGNPSFSVIGQPDIKTWDQLKGGTIAVSGPTDGAANVFRLMARQHGMEAQKDYSFAPVGTTPARYAALKAKQVKGAIMTEALTIQAVGDGFSLIERSNLPHYTFIVAAVGRPWAQSHRDQLVRYLKAQSQAADWLYNPANKQAAVALLASTVKISNDVATKTYEDYIEKGQGQIVTKGAKIDLEGLKNMGDVLQSLGLIKQVDVSKWADNSYADAAAK
jgi:ABC-type nitrate/sulfonate/bicarbonate transport system substrate-binding protein